MRKALIVFALAFILILPAIARADLNNGLVAYYSLDGDAKDYSGNGFNGIEHGQVLFVSGKIGKGVKFNSQEDYIDLPFKKSKDDFSISMWIKPQDFTVQRFLMDDGRDGEGHDTDPWIWLFLSSSASKDPNKVCWNWEDIYAGNHDYLCSKNSLNINSFYHIVIVRENYYKKIYINGKLDNMQRDDSTPNYFNPHPIKLGGKSDGPDQYKYFNGIIDEVRIYNRALSESEIKELYEQGLNTCSGGGYTEADLQKKYQEGIEEGKKICQQNPSACGITVSSSDYQTGYNNGYNKGYEDGKNSCSGTSQENPFLPPTTSSQCATFDFFTNKFHVPCFQGTNATYWLDFKLINQNPVQLEMTKFGKNK